MVSQRREQLSSVFNNPNIIISDDQNPNSSMWIDEAIWGHRLYDEQTPWFTYLEFMNIVISEDSRDSLLQEIKGFNKLIYKPHQRLYLRNILFNYPLARMINILHDEKHDDARWKKWLDDIYKMQQGIIQPDFTYIRKHFKHFDDFVDIVKLVQSCCFEINSNKRWTSKFVFPYCKEALYEDLDNEANTNDRRFFARTGELLYLMLCRASSKDKLINLIKKRLLDNFDPTWTAIIKSLQPNDINSYKISEREAGFLPYKNHDCFDMLCDDWCALLELCISPAELIPHIVRITGFHLLRYQQIISKEICNDPYPSYYVSEIIAPKKTSVREHSVNSYQQNNQQSLKAIINFIDNLKNTDEWKSAINNTDSFETCKEFLRQSVLWPRKDDDYEGNCNPDDLYAELKSSALRRHEQHAANVHRVYGKEIGLVSKRGTNQLRYAPDDSFLKTLIITTVVQQMEFSEFLSKVFDKYNVVIGDIEADKMMNISKADIDKKSFQNNAVRLEHRLSCMGLLKRLSDGCAYIINPYAGGNNGNI